MKMDYESRVRRQKFKKLVLKALLTLAICAVIVAPILYIWDVSMQMRSSLREAKNVMRNTELLSIRYTGQNMQWLDVTRYSGVTEQAEKEILEYAGASGDMSLVGWDETAQRVLGMTYRTDKFLVIYEKARGAEEGTWYIYWQIRKLPAKTVTV